MPQGKSELESDLLRVLSSLFPLSPPRFPVCLHYPIKAKMPKNNDHPTDQLDSN